MRLTDADVTGCLMGGEVLNRSTNISPISLTGCEMPTLNWIRRKAAKDHRQVPFYLLLETSFGL
jgi:hypothetical protein